MRPQSDEEMPERENRRLARALEHPLRRRIFAELNEQPASLSSLARALDVPLSMVGYHYAVLGAVGGVRATDRTARACRCGERI